MKSGAAVAGICLTAALVACAPASGGQESSFEGSWSASGRRHAVALGDGKEAVIVEISGAVVLASGEGLSGGFRGEAIGFDDGEGLSVGRRMRLARIAAELDLDQVAAVLEISRRTLERIEAGTRPPTRVELVVFAELVQQDISFFGETSSLSEEPTLPDPLPGVKRKAA